MSITPPLSIQHPSQFADYTQTPDWAKTALTKMVEEGVFQGYPPDSTYTAFPTGDTFRGTAPLSRFEAAAMMNAFYTRPFARLEDRVSALEQRLNTLA
jgi:hypothetical protein